MESNQTDSLSQRPVFWLIIVIAIFFLKGVFLSVLLPLFQGPDEQTHYATIQYLSESKEKSWPIVTKKSIPEKNNIATYHFSQEIIKSAQITQFDEIISQRENTQEFSNSIQGLDENELLENHWKRYIDIYPVNTSGYSSFYYSVASALEKSFPDQSILFRFFMIRLISVFLGVAIVWLCYLTTRKIGLSSMQSLTIATLIAFQPMFSATAAIVNIDISLIFSFSLFTYASVSLLKDSFRLMHILLLFFSLVLAFFSKGPGIVLFIIVQPLLVYLAYKHFKVNPRKFFWFIFLGVSVVIGSFFLAVPKDYLISLTNLGAISKFNSPAESLSKYIEKTTAFGALKDMHASYWGNFGWLDTKIPSAVLDVIWIVEIISLLGIILFIFSKKKIEYLPNKKFILFSIGILAALQLAIRFYDWRVFDTTGKIIIGTPGRYFLPNIIPHILLVVTGLGFFTKNEKQFNVLIKVLAILMILLSLYSIFDVIIPRYYL